MYVIHPYYLLHLKPVKTMHLYDLSDVICSVMNINSLNAENTKSRLQCYVIAKAIFCIIASKLIDDAVDNDQ
jgi:hypothetical protein